MTRSEFSNFIYDGTNDKLYYKLKATFFKIVFVYPWQSRCKFFCHINLISWIHNTKKH